MQANYLAEILGATVKADFWAGMERQPPVGNQRLSPVTILQQVFDADGNDLETPADPGPSADQVLAALQRARGVIARVNAAAGRKALADSRAAS